MKRSLLFYGKIAGALLVAVVYWGTAMCVAAAWLYIQSLDVPDHRPLAVTSDKPVCATEGQRKFVALEAMPPLLKSAVVAAADPDFYARSPVNPFIEFAAAALFDRRPAALAFSTSVTRCLTLAWLDRQSEKNRPSWHPVNAILLHRIERDLSKDRIFEIYLNEIWMGADVRGVAAAAKFYMGKQLSDLTVAEAAYLAALPRSPNQFIHRKDYALGWRDQAIDRMAQSGAISTTEAEDAKNQPLPVTASTY